MSDRVTLSYIFCTIIIVSACLVAGCSSGVGHPDNTSHTADIAATQPAMVSPVIIQLKKQPYNLTINENTELHAGNLSLVFAVSDKSRDPVKQTVNFELTVKIVGNETVAELQKKLSDLYAVDRSGKQYCIPTHVALIGIKPGETRTGNVEIADVPDQAPSRSHLPLQVRQRGGLLGDHP